MLFILLFQIIICNAQVKKSINIDTKSEALKFSLQVIKTLFENNCSSYLKNFNDTIYNFSDNKVIKVVTYKDVICTSYSRAIRDKRFTYNNYLLNFKTQVFTQKEIILKYPAIKMGGGFLPLESDFIFVGNLAKLKSTDSFNLIWDDMFGFVVRKINGSWKIISIGG